MTNILGSFLTEKCFDLLVRFPVFFFPVLQGYGSVGNWTESDSIAKGLLLESFRRNKPRVVDFLNEWTNICETSSGFCLFF